MKNQQGFTLIELSIVLVIIGLIVGGVLVGQDLIKAAQLRKVASDFERYNAAANTFKVKYNCLAGDCPNAATFGVGSNGDGDKVIDYDNGSGAWRDNHAENWFFWQHLGNAGLVSGTFTGATGACGGFCHVIDENVPGGAIEGSMVTFFILPNWTIWPPSINNKHVMATGTPSATGRWHYAAFTPIDMMSIDQKFDDGMPYLGQIGDIVGAGASATPNCTTSEVVATAEYDLSSNNKECLILWKAQF